MQIKGKGQQPESQGQQLMDASQARAMLAYQQQLMQQQLQEQLMAQEMAMYQQQQALQAQHQAQLQALQAQLQQQQQLYHAAHLDANDIRKVMSSLKPGESFDVELYQGFEVRHNKQRMNGPQILVALIIVVIIIGLVLNEGPTLN